MLTIIDTLFSHKWYKRLPRDGISRVLLDVKPKCFGEFIDYLNKHNITPPECYPQNQNVWEEEDAVIQNIMLPFGLINNGKV